MKPMTIDAWGVNPYAQLAWLISAQRMRRWRRTAPGR